MLFWRACCKFDAISGKEGCGADRLRDTTLAIHDELLHGPVRGEPRSIEGMHETVFRLVRDFDGGMPSCATVQEVHDTLLIDEDNVAFNLLVEFVRDLDRSNTCGKRVHPLSAHRASVDNVGNKVNDFSRKTSSTQNGRHGLQICMPPPKM